MPLVSFVVTCRNLESFIGPALDSIFAQTATNDYEIIILDDASTDGSDAVIRSFRDPQIRYIRHTERQGEVLTVNEGLTAAQGTYVARLDGDDLLRPAFLNLTLPILERYPEVGLVYGDAATIDARGNLLQDPWQGLRTRENHGGQAFKGDEYLALVRENVVSATCLIRHTALQVALPIPSDFINSHWYTNLRIARQYEFYYLPVTFFDYRLHGNNRHLTIKSDPAYAHTVFRILDQVFSEPDRQAEKRKIRRAVYGNVSLKMADACFGAGRMQAARNLYMRALVYQPGYLLKTDFVRHWVGTFLGVDRYNHVKSRILARRASG